MATLDHIAEPLRKLAVTLDSLTLDPANARKHSPKNLAAITASLKRFGQRLPIVVQREGMIVRAGNGRVMAAREMGWTHIAAVVCDDENIDAVAFAIADNRSAELAEWDDEALAALLSELPDDVVADLGFDEDDLAALEGDAEVTEDEAPAPLRDAVSRRGDLWQLGQHRLLCGDSTDGGDVAMVMGGAEAVLIHADPPYGMGKESEGVANDNLYREKLDDFQMLWWEAARPHLADNGSAYVWGNAEDLWRLWHGRLSKSERMTLRNEIVWDKGSGMGMSSDIHRQFATATERCLFFMMGEQGFGSVNKDDFLEGYEPIRARLLAEVEKAGWGASEVNTITGVRMFWHWFSKSQWEMIPEKHYNALAEAAEGRAFTDPYSEVRAMYSEVRAMYDGTRAYFDNTHDNMTDVWSFPRVTGDDRHGHATPKPMFLVGRAIQSSAPKGAGVLEPFSGSGTTIIAAEQLGRRCYAIEIEPLYVDVAIRRWQKLTGQHATLDGISWSDVAAQRGVNIEEETVVKTLG